jgi:hypothetical protein
VELGWECRVKNLLLSARGIGPEGHRANTRKAMAVHQLSQGSQGVELEMPFTGLLLVQYCLSYIFTLEFLLSSFLRGD